MNLFQPISIAAAYFLALSACATAPPPPQASASAAKAPPPAASDGLAQPAAAQDSAYGGANTSGTDPYGAIQTGGQQAGQQTNQELTTSAPQQANTETTEGVVVMAPDGTVWSRGRGVNADYQGDVDSCYAYARGQVDHDARIESDVTSAFRFDSAGLGLTALRGRMSNFERHNRVPALFNSCMVAKGYDRQ